MCLITFLSTNLAYIMHLKMCGEPNHFELTPQWKFFRKVKIKRIFKRKWFVVCKQGLKELSWLEQHYLKYLEW